MSLLDKELRTQLEKVFDDGFSDDAIKHLTSKVGDALTALQEELEYQIKANCPYNLARWVEGMAETAITAMLEGDDERMRKALSCQEGHWTGRDRDHPIIHGKLFETGAIELRKKVVEAHAELLKTQRVLDLEDQVKSLVQQVNKANHEKDQMWERVRASEGL